MWWKTDEETKTYTTKESGGKKTDEVCGKVTMKWGHEGKDKEA